MMMAIAVAAPRNPLNLLPIELWDLVSRKARQPLMSVNTSFRDQSLYYSELLREFAELPATSAIGRLYTKYNPKALSDREKVEKICTRAQRAFEWSQSILPHERQVAEPDLRSVSLQRLMQLDRDICRRRDEVIIAFFRTIAAQIPLANTFQQSIQALPPELQASSIRQWMSLHREALIFYQTDQADLTQLPGIPKEAVQFLTPEQLQSENMAYTACRTASFEFLSHLLENLDLPAKEITQQTKRILARLMSEGENDIVRKMIQFCRKKGIVILYREVIMERLVSFPITEEELADLVQRPEFAQIPWLELKIAFDSAAIDRVVFYFKALLNHYPNLNTIPPQDLIALLGRCCSQCSTREKKELFQLVMQKCGNISHFLVSVVWLGLQNYGFRNEIGLFVSDALENPDLSDERKMEVVHVIALNSTRFRHLEWEPLNKCLEYAVRTKNIRMTRKILQHPILRVAYDEELFEERWKPVIRRGNVDVIPQLLRLSPPRASSYRQEVDLPRRQTEVTRPRDKDVFMPRLPRIPYRAPNYRPERQPEIIVMAKRSRCSFTAKTLGVLTLVAWLGVGAVTAYSQLKS